MSTFKELQEEYSKKPNTLNISKDQKYTYIYPIKIEKVNDEHHLFMMVRYTAGKYISLVLFSETKIINELVSDSLHINIPLDKFDLTTNTIFINGYYSYIMDGSKLNIDMLNYLRELNIKDKLEWIDINKSNVKFGEYTSKIKDQIIQNLKDGKIFN
jgi:hypothetical protein